MYVDRGNYVSHPDFATVLAEGLPGAASIAKQ